MVVGMLILIALTALFYHVTSAIDESLTSSQPHPQAALDSALRQVVSHPDSWHDPAWQASTMRTFRQLHRGLVIRDASGKVMLRTSRGWQGWQAGREILVTDRGRTLGTVEVFDPPEGPPGFLPMLVALVVALLFIGWQIGRAVVRPLEALSRAARRIARGELEFDLPNTPVREVAEVNAAFEAMRDGLKRSIERQAEIEEQRRFFVSAIAHDLRTPLFSLRGYLEGLEIGIARSPERAARYIEVCRQKADQLERLVSDLFAYTRAEHLEQTLGRERLELGGLLEDVADGFRPLARAKGVEIAPRGASEPCFCECDPHLLRRATENLLDNALRHTPAGGRIEVSWHAEPGRAVFSVADTGPGIRSEDLERIFEPMYRADTARSSDTGGSGLGLTIARRILRAHGGDLTAANAEGGGALFTAWLPSKLE